jgi:hypothetical protein
MIRSIHALDVTRKRFGFVSAGNVRYLAAES